MLQLSQPTNGHTVIILSHPRGTAEPCDRGYLKGLKRKRRVMLAVFAQWITWFWHKFHIGLSLLSERNLKCSYLSHSGGNEREPSNPKPPMDGSGKQDRESNL